ncbi:hypothetical protein [Streptomyces sp. NPDC048172]|uniref:hypothetical protein n=1 Tax=Streptomyces sp. NPDC048172 TaxID=3365505 RepID=UPI0037156D08
MTMRNGGRVNSRRSIRPLTLLVCVSVLGLTGCGDDAPEREYAIPQELCGVPVKAKLLGPLLPGGKKTLEKEHMGTEDTGGLSCDLVVDEHSAIGVFSTWESTTPEPTDAGGTGSLRNPSPPESPATLRGGSYIVGDRIAKAAVPCVNPKVRMPLPTPEGEKSRSGPAKGFTFAVQLFNGPEDTEESKKALRRLMGPFSKALVKKLPCRGA